MGQCQSSPPPARKVHAIFGFGDIRDFTKHSEVLQEDVLVFVNEIARLVHREAQRSGGAPNNLKFMGDAFLCAWKLPATPLERELQRSLVGASGSSTSSRSAGSCSPTPPVPSEDADAGSGRALPSGALRPRRQTALTIGLVVGEGGQAGAQPLAAPYPVRAHALQFNYRQVQGVSLLATNALAAFVNLAIRTHCESLPGRSLHRFLLPTGSAGGGAKKEAQPPTSIHLGYGLHVGWAIEGAIGSGWKREPSSLLSPAVNVTARLESATRAYRCAILLSRTFCAALCAEVLPLLRRVDCVRLKNVEEPMELYTFDWDPGAAQWLLLGAPPCAAPRPQEPYGPLLGERFPGEGGRYAAPPGGGGCGMHAGGSSGWASLEEQVGDLAALQPSWVFTEEFVRLSEAAVDEYIGDGGGRRGQGKGLHPRWTLALQHAQGALRVRPGDGPLLRLVKTIEELGVRDGEGGLQAPPLWKGWREMKEK